jgi:hypothetical protein
MEINALLLRFKNIENEDEDERGEFQKTIHKNIKINYELLRKTVKMNNGIDKVSRFCINEGGMIRRHNIIKKHNYDTSLSRISNPDDLIVPIKMKHGTFHTWKMVYTLLLNFPYIEGMSFDYVRTNEFIEENVLTFSKTGCIIQITPDTYLRSLILKCIEIENWSGTFYSLISKSGKEGNNNTFMKNVGKYSINFFGKKITIKGFRDMVSYKPYIISELNKCQTRSGVVEKIFLYIDECYDILNKLENLDEETNIHTGLYENNVRVKHTINQSNLDNLNKYELSPKGVRTESEWRIIILFKLIIKYPLMSKMNYSKVLDKSGIRINVSSDRTELPKATRTLSEGGGTLSVPQKGGSGVEDYYKDGVFYFNRGKIKVKLTDEDKEYINNYIHDKKDISDSLFGIKNQMYRKEISKYSLEILGQYKTLKTITQTDEPKERRTRVTK